MTNQLTKLIGLLAMLLSPVFLSASSDTADAAQNSLSYLFAVYILTWGIFFLYAIFITRKQRSLQREIEGLRQAIQNQEKQKEGPT